MSSARAKLSEQIKLLVDDRMLEDLKQAAFDADRSVSDYVRHVLALHLYGHARMLNKRLTKSRGEES
jgi:hypothetical protein